MSEIFHKIIFCVIDNAEPPTILSGLLYFDFTNFEQGYTKLFRTLNLVVPKEKPRAKAQVKPIKKTPKPRKKSLLSKQKKAVIKPVQKYIKSNVFLSEDDVKAMLIKHNFFHSKWNNIASGFKNKYKIRVEEERFDLLNVIHYSPVTGNITTRRILNFDKCKIFAGMMVFLFGVCGFFWTLFS